MNSGAGLTSPVDLVLELLPDLLSLFGHWHSHVLADHRGDASALDHLLIGGYVDFVFWPLVADNRTFRHRLIPFPAIRILNKL